MVGFGTVDMMRNASRQKKAETAAAKTPAGATDKPITNTSGTAGAKKTDMKQTMKQIKFGAQMAGGMGAMAGFLGMPFTRNVQGTAMVVDPLNQQVVGKGSYVKAPKEATVGGFPISPSVKKPTTPAGTGIDAPAPDTGWRPSGTNSALGLQQTQMGIPLQETVGVSKRKR
tara:strand:- start:7385 stop:7897 length:513 start_codon:yes stop_codon:yes gene_type:complete